MENNSLGLLGKVASAGCGGADPGGGGVFSGGGSMSTVSKEFTLILSSEESSSYPDESGLELGLGLSLLGGGALKSKPAPPSSGHYARILTAKDFPSLVSTSSSSSSSSSATTKANASSAGTKRAADSVTPPRKGLSSVVGWPPIGAYRMNSLANQSRSPPTEEFDSTVDKDQSKMHLVDEANNGSDKNENDAKERGPSKTSWFVKVNMDGIPIGRKVDLSAHSCYKTLAQMLEYMFCTPTASISAKRSNMKRHDVGPEAIGTSKLLDGSAGFVLTYEDKEGDWMLIGDVPWGMFLSSVRRLKIMRTSEANGLGVPSLQERNVRHMAKPAYMTHHSVYFQ